jgi:broad specificity phosphatase PhoE
MNQRLALRRASVLGLALGTSASLLITVNSSDCRAASTAVDKTSAIRACAFHSNAKIIHFVRHAEGEHNAAAKFNPAAYLKSDYEDAQITNIGKEQCSELRIDVMEKVKHVELLVVSPMSRTMETAELTFPQLIGRIPWIAVENVRERTGRHPCDKRRSLKFYRHRFPHVDFNEIDSNEDPLYKKYNFSREPEEDIILRAKTFLEWLSKRPEREIIVVTHDGYLRTLLTKVIDSTTFEGETEFVKFSNCEMRTFLVEFPLQL